MSAATIGIYAAQNGSETRPTTSGRGVFEVKRAAGSVAHSITLAYTLRSTSTTTTADYQPLSGIVTIPAGARTAAFNVIPVDDALVEGTEKVDITLKNRSDATNVHTWAEITIADNDVAPALPEVSVVTSANASETDPTGAGKGTFTFSRTGSTAAALVLNYTVTNASTATSGSDYAALSGTVTIPAGQSSAVVSVTPVDDSTDEGDETVVVKLDASSGYTLSHQTATLIISDNDHTTTQGWFGTDGQTSRTAFTMSGNGHDRTNEPVDYAVNFTSVLTGLGKSGSLQDGSIRVVETNAAGDTVINNNVPFQFDHAVSGYNASTNASGDLVVQPAGTTAASATRYFQVYFDTASSVHGPSVTAHVATTDNTPDITLDPNGATINSVKIQTDNATYYFQKGEGAFSHIIDNSGKDWVTWNADGGTAQSGDDSNTGSGGRFRGLPNLGSLGFHPYRNHNVTTTVLSSGPLKTTLQAVNSPNGDKVIWEIYSTFARLTVMPHDQNQGYMMLYEGTPGGAINSTDSVTRSNGVTTDINTTTNAPLGGGSGVGADEWIYFRDSSVGTNGRYLFLTHNNTDSLEDDYYEMHDSTGDMTVFGFGRQNVNGGTNQLLIGNNTFTIGLGDDGSNFNTTASAIEGQYQAVTLASNGNAKLS